jgi:hypothetical protein
MYDVWVNYWIDSLPQNMVVSMLCCHHTLITEAKSELSVLIFRGGRRGEHEKTRKGQNMEINEHKYVTLSKKTKPENQKTCIKIIHVCMKLGAS